MPDHAVPGLLRIALVFGDEDAALHVREAMHGHADIVYATSATEFDAARMAGANVVAALVNLDDGDWLDAIETRLDEDGIAVVYNDPEISRGLEGWGRARWLRHLLAKLRHSTDVDPPRPEQGSPSAVVNAAAAESESPALTKTEAAVVERPLSPQEIETMTADFVAKQQTTSVQIGAEAPQFGIVFVDGPTAAAAPVDAVDRKGVDARLGFSDPADEAPEPVPIEAGAADAPSDAATTPRPMDTDADDDGNLDVDTETLSAMIDARLAGSESTPSDSPEVWRVVEGGADSTVSLDTDTKPEAASVPTASRPAEQPRIETTVLDDADVLASLPSLDDWQLVDPETAPAPAPAPAASPEPEDDERAFSDRFAGLELVPMETAAAMAIHSDPIERWLHDDESGKRNARAVSAAKTGSRGGNG